MPVKLTFSRFQACATLAASLAYAVVPQASAQTSESIQGDNTKSNLLVAHDAIARVGQPGWADLLADDVVFEFPYASSIGYQGKIEGKPAVLKYIAGVIAYTNGLTMFDISSTASSKKDEVYNEYKGRYGVAPGVTQKYISIQRFRNGKLIYQKEYWDPTPFVKIQAEKKARENVK